MLVNTQIHLVKNIFTKVVVLTDQYRHLQCGHFLLCIIDVYTHHEKLAITCSITLMIQLNVRNCFALTNRTFVVDDYAQ